jgi:very-long-chain (3R)-3-hydroxyacyl-CoA dehydratase
MTLSSSYLTAYNGLSCALWTYILALTLAYAPALYASGNLYTLYYELLSHPLAGTQTLALVEIAHAATGLVRASPVTTAIQVVGKNLVVWTVMVAFPEIVLGTDQRGAIGVWPFLGCVVFWGVSEVVRYGYFVVLLTTGDVPGWLKWLRYVSLFCCDVAILRRRPVALLPCRSRALSLETFFRKGILIFCEQVQRFHRLVSAGFDQ